MAQLTPEQVMLLENLTYCQVGGKKLSSGDYDGKSIADYINSLDLNSIKGKKDAGSGISGDEWIKTINAIKNDETLMNMKIAETHVDRAEGGGGGGSAVFIDEESKEAVVAFQGTAKREWNDNFLGGAKTDAADHVSTAQQENALNWYRDTYDRNGLSDYKVTVTGHSKGGNKAKYITIMDNTVDRCISIDGQGFSDEFYDKYADKIGANQDKITNYNNANDYVNFLLNDVGTTKYYEGQNVDGLLDNHAPNAFFIYNKDGTISIKEGKRSEIIAELDEFLNGYLRSLSPEERKATMELIGKLVQKKADGADIKELYEILSNEENRIYIAKLITYISAYGNDKMGRALFSILGIEECYDYVKTVSDIANSRYFKYLRRLLLNGAIPTNVLTDWLYKKLFEKLGEKFLPKDIKNILWIVNYINDNVHNVEIRSGRDRRVNTDGSEDDLVRKITRTKNEIKDIVVENIISKNDEMCSDFNIDTLLVRREAGKLINTADLMKDNGKSIAKLGRLWITDIKVLKALSTLSAQLQKEANEMKTLGTNLIDIISCYKKAEEKIISQD